MNRSNYVSGQKHWMVSCALCSLYKGECKCPDKPSKSYRHIPAFDERPNTRANTRQEAIDMLVAYAQKLAENPRQ